MLEKATNLPQMRAMNVGEVVTVVRVVAVPKAYAHALGVNVIGDQSVGAFRRTGTGSNLDRARDSRNLWRPQLRLPSPKVAQITVMKIVGQVGRDISSDSGHQIPGLLGPRGSRGDLSKRVAREESTDIGLNGGYPAEIIYAVADHKVTDIAKVVVEPSHAKVALNRRYYISLEPLGVVAIAESQVVRLRHVFRPEILDRGVKPQSARVTGLLRAICGIAAHGSRPVRRVRVKVPRL